MDGDSHRSQLAGHRERLGLSQEDLAAKVGVTASTIGRWERGLATPRRSQRPLAKALGVSVERLLRILANQDIGEDPERVRLRLTPSWLSAYISMEQAAREIRAFESYSVHALLQTPDYARAILASRFPQEDGQVGKLVEARLARQEALRRLSFEMILSEMALVDQIGTAATMQAQLRKLIEQTALPNITVRILPFGCGPHAGTQGEFICLTFPWETPTTPSAVYVESYFAGSTVHDTAGMIAEFARLYAHLESIALPEEQSLDLIHRYELEYIRARH